MAEYPFIAVLYEQLGAAGTGTLSFQASANEEYTFTQIRQQSTGEYHITSIRDSRGLYYANFDSTDFPFSNIFADTENANNGLTDFPIPLVLPGATTIYFDVADNSGAANPVRIFLIGKRKVG